MTTLVDVLDAAMRTWVVDGKEDANIGSVAAGVTYSIPSETREALEVGLLLAEVERQTAQPYPQPPRDGASWSIYRSDELCTVLALLPFSSHHNAAEGPTLHAALTALLEQLPVPEPVDELRHDQRVTFG